MVVSKQRKALQKQSTRMFDELQFVVVLTTNYFVRDDKLKFIGHKASILDIVKLDF